MTKTTVKYWDVDISRAILDSANAFGNLGKVGEEYFTNSLDAFETIVHDNPSVALNRLDCSIRMVIDIPKKEIVFEDRHPLMGMSEEKVFNSFFKLHGENEARKRFVNVRGKYGTGKVASFGINAKYFIVDTVYKGLRTTVKATRKAFYSGEKPKLDVINSSEKANGMENGTTITISLENCNYISERGTQNAIKYFQKIFGRFLDRYFIELVLTKSSHHIREMRLSYNPPNAVYEKEYLVPKEYQKLLGETALIIKRAAEPIEDENQRGILITSNFYPKEQTYFELGHKSYADRYFGEWEIPLLDKYEGANPPMLSTRELVLNKNNKMVQAIYEFGKQVLDTELAQFAEDEKARKRDETTKKLDKIAQELTSLLNDDFSDYEETKSAGKGNKGDVHKKGDLDGYGDSKPDPNSKDTEVKKGGKGSFIKDPEGDLIGKFKIIKKEEEEKKGRKIKRKKESKLRKDDNIDKKGTIENVKRHRYGGGFTVKFEQLNHNDFLARIDKNTKIIVVNLDSDPMKAHLKNCKGNIYDSVFRMFAYSIAIDEYSRFCIHTQADNSEFFGTPPEAAQEAADAIREIKKRIFDKLAAILKTSSNAQG